jgi:hypothetical protein
MTKQILASKIGYMVFNKTGNNYFSKGRIFGCPKVAFRTVMNGMRANDGIFGRKRLKRFSEVYRIDKVEILTRIVKKNYHTENYYKKRLIARLKREIAAERK